jgi:hypothetical protein
MSKSTAKYRGSLRRFNSKPLSKSQSSQNQNIESSQISYNQFNPVSGKHEVIRPDGEVKDVLAPQNKPMGTGDSGFMGQGFFVL